MVEPKKIQRSLADKKLPRKRCENPMCEHWLPMRKVRAGAKYCDNICRNEHQHIQGLERRPAEVHCAFCDALIDTEKRGPSSLERGAVFFCDQICVDGYRRKNNEYKVMQRRGTIAVKEYKEKHGKAHAYEERAKAVSENNTKAPPKNKNFDRQGKVWGYDVQFKGTGKDYIVTVPELPEIEEFHSKTMKAGLRSIREKIVEMRVEQRKTEANAPQ